MHLLGLLSVESYVAGRETGDAAAETCSSALSAKGNLLGSRPFADLPISRFVKPGTSWVESFNLGSCNLGYFSQSTPKSRLQKPYMYFKT